MTHRSPWLPALLLFLGAQLACDVEPSAEMDGRAMYLRFCASCHGVDGRGGGPAAAALRTPPTDLTTLAAREGGFHPARVMRVIDGRREIAAHGPRAMPVWGAVFEEELAEDPYTRYTARLRTRELVEYLGSIQRPGDAPDEGGDPDPGGGGA